MSGGPERGVGVCSQQVWRGRRRSRTGALRRLEPRARGGVGGGDWGGAGVPGKS